ncbi:PilN domain-containing protein [Marinicella sp. S1101]|uniref:PilN domain-containing protein n=1 Tax=Marinicella marina TaxID=2996016 RepID=UPI002260E1BA|nr:PilN domain-containing protein [Marinicella marina]MCX7554467.1 PilN domain-containing protein [Marinicella marina]MDJ1140618.1 PilN domain-containing protein [Marinicella marina]
MAKINLLPWREERRQQQTNEYFIMLGLAAGLALLLFGLAYYYFDQSIKFQNKRNAYMTGEITKLDKQIEEIKQLEKQKAGLIARQQVIEELQANRTQMVHLFDELVQTIPNGVFLEKITQQGTSISMEGYSQSHSRVSDYMRRLDESEWFNKIELDYIKADDTLGTHEQKFKLSVKLVNPNRKKDDDVDEEEVS